ncbi:MAG: pyrroline-5-carboxylate reductase [Pseudomonadota bacterium]
MDQAELETRGITMLGCGKMGSAILRGWLDGGMRPAAVHVIEPHPTDWLRSTGVAIGGEGPPAPAVLMLAVKPQMMAEALAPVAGLGGGGTLVVSIAAGTPISAFEAAFGAGTPVVRAMPNIPAAVGRGVTALVANDAAGAAGLALAERLMESVGRTVRLSSEAEMDSVTAVSGSGPGYVFHMVEALAVAGEAEGLAPDLAMALARATIAGAGAMLDATDTPAAALRESVTSQKGTTAAGLEVLMDDLPDLMTRTVAAAAARSRELGQ